MASGCRRELHFARLSSRRSVGMLCFCAKSEAEEGLPGGGTIVEVLLTARDEALCGVDSPFGAMAIPSVKLASRLLVSRAVQQIFVP